MDYILKGDPKEVAKVIRENRIRVQRGVISFTPVEPETVIEDVEEVVTPDTTESVEDTATPDTSEDAPTNEETDTNTEPAEPMDDKNIEVEDVKEVDLDADDKTTAPDDTKDVQEDDVKETTPAKKTSKRSKKSE